MCRPFGAKKFGMKTAPNAGTDQVELLDRLVTGDGMPKV